MAESREGLWMRAQERDRLKVLHEVKKQTSSLAPCAPPSRLQSGTFYFALTAGKWIKIVFRSFPLPKFEDCLQRLEKIVQELEKGEVPLEKSLTLFEEGMQLSAACRKELDEAEGKVEILLKQNGKIQAEPLEPDSARK